MKKSIRMGVKPLAMATAFAAGTSVSMIALALPGGDTLDAVGTVTESICVGGVDMTISGGGGNHTRSVTNHDVACQVRTLPPTKGFVLSEPATSSGTVNDSSPLVHAGGELYEAYVNGLREAAVLLTPNRALATSRSIRFTAGNGGSVSYDMAASVQPTSNLQDSALTGTYTIISRNHAWDMVASGIELSVYANPNFALGEVNYTRAMTVDFKGDGGCDILDSESHRSFHLTKDPTMDGFGEMGVSCFDGGGYCGQSDGRDYIAAAAVNLGQTAGVGVVGGRDVGPGEEYDWQDSSGDVDNNGVVEQSCDYIANGSTVTVNYHTKHGDLTGPPEGLTHNVWSSTYQVSADLRYLVSDGTSVTDFAVSGGSGNQKGGIAVGVRTGATNLEGKTYLFNALDATYASSTPTNALYENPGIPVYQEEECIARGSLSLGAAGACSVDMVSTCSGRNHAGKEETADGAADGTITDALTVFNGAPQTPPSCSWSGTASDLQVSLGVLDQNGNPVTMQYTGSASDNGEALVLQGVYNVYAATPDVDNAPLLAPQDINMLSFMVAQEYQASLSADQDADGVNNLGEFQWAEGYALAGNNDYSGDLVGDIYWYRPTDGGADKPAGGTQIWEMFNNQRYAQLYPGIKSLDFAPAATGDLDGDGLTDVIFHNATTGLNHTWLTTNVWLPVNQAGKVESTLPSTAPGYDVVASGDFDGDLDDDVLIRNAASGATHVWLIQDPANCVGGACRVGESFLPVISGAFSVAAVADFNNDEVDDIYWYNSTTGAAQVWEMGGAGVVQSVAYQAPINLAYKPVGAADTDGDGDADVVLHNAATGQVQVRVMQNLNTASTAYPPALPVKFSFAGAADFNSDGVEDFLWRDQSTGEQRLWNMRHNKRWNDVNLQPSHVALKPVF